MIRLDFIEGHEDIKIYQDTDMFLINTDTTVLGEFVEVYKNDTVLDMGTNTGALLLYASRWNPKKMIGIDINTRALELAKKNMELNNIDYCTLKEANILTYREDPVDVIICNPPYFKTDEANKADNKYKNLAKHESLFTLSELIDSISRNLKDNGTLYFLYLTSRMDDCMIELRKHNLWPKVCKMVFDDNKKYSNVFVVKCKKNAKQGMVMEKPIIIKR
ncbi:MAG: methyltransferase domain-containing protein [Acholeplasmatales bacterium]|nr:methyltransferase domain-containing protein [Acholeplasmatales bacterium]